MGEEAPDRVRSGHPVFPPQAPASCPRICIRAKGSVLPRAGQPGLKQVSRECVTVPPGEDRQAQGPSSGGTSPGPTLEGRSRPFKTCSMAQPLSSALTRMVPGLHAWGDFRQKAVLGRRVL